MKKRSGFYDRRGFDRVLKLHLGVMVVGLALVVYGLSAWQSSLAYWTVDLTIFLYACLAFIVVEAVIAPPANNPENFELWSRRQHGKKPVLLCLGDSLTHGTCSGSFTPEIPLKLSLRLGLPPPKNGTFMDPIWVVNAGQNSLTTYTLLHERLSKALGYCRPDYILIMIGTNDMRGVYRRDWGEQSKTVFDLPEAPTMESFERNLKGILDFIHQASPKSQVCVCTLPPMGENLDHRANQIVRQGNQVIERVVSQAQGEVSILPVYSRLETVIEKKRRRKLSLPIDCWFTLAVLMTALYHLLPFVFDWNILSSLVGHTVLSDALHLNERGRDEVVDLIVDWLVKANVAKAIAAKS